MPRWFWCEIKFEIPGSKASVCQTIAWIPDGRTPLQSFWFVRSGVGHRMCISNKFQVMLRVLLRDPVGGPPSETPQVTSSSPWLVSMNHIYECPATSCFRSLKINPSFPNLSFSFLASPTHRSIKVLCLCLLDTIYNYFQQSSQSRMFQSYNSIILPSLKISPGVGGWEGTCSIYFCTSGFNQNTWLIMGA